MDADLIRTLIEMRSTKAQVEPTHSASPSIYTQLSPSSRLEDSFGRSDPSPPLYHMPTPPTRRKPVATPVRDMSPGSEKEQLDDSPLFPTMAPVGVDDSIDMQRSMSLLGPKMKIHCPAPWETEDEPAQETDRKAKSNRSFHFPSSSGRPHRRPSIESSRTTASSQHPEEGSGLGLGIPQASASSVALSIASTSPGNTPRFGKLLPIRTAKSQSNSPNPNPYAVSEREAISRTDSQSTMSSYVQTLRPSTDESVQHSPCRPYHPYADPDNLPSPRSYPEDDRYNSGSMASKAINSSNPPSQRPRPSPRSVLPPLPTERSDSFSSQSEDSDNSMRFKAKTQGSKARKALGMDEPLPEVEPWMMPNGTITGQRFQRTDGPSIPQHVEYPATPKAEPFALGPAPKTIKHKKSGLMRLFNGGNHKEKKEKEPDFTHVPLPRSTDPSLLTATRGTRPPVPSPRVSSFADVVSSSSSEAQLPPIPITPSRPRPNRRPPPSLAVSVNPSSPPTKTTPLPPVPVSPHPPRSRTQSSPRLASHNSTPPISAPPSTTSFNTLSLRPVSTLFSNMGHYLSDVSPSDSGVTSSISSSTTASSTPMTSPLPVTPVTKGDASSMATTLLASSSASSHEDPEAVIVALQDQIVKSRKAWQLQTWEYESQIKELKAELEILRAGERCNTCGRGGKATKKVVAAAGSVVNRPRRAPGGGTRTLFGSGDE
ncbi:hypothetical protein SISNIDRAFT_483360 [Sistotremastrum niveocremeum HHB9708]|uniref:Uncharacterized protein n=2 Tax=Sistotremastraceae TaxID=3402574 RepID=A0A164XG17_9AGAM|nr:hypothetical protein SISNIDRAFT_483360 [Sistotremastrum niveocremeum HHB9708]KZT41334.1 hypothetical protein SISSUDRAFT_1059477 [Sistotremastrum suecicum HHB10207 ss-3]